MTFEDAIAFGLSLPRTELGRSYGKSAVRLTDNGRAFLVQSHECGTSFGVAIDLDTIEFLKETNPDIFWQSPHYRGWEVVLVRYQCIDDDRVREIIQRSRDWVEAKPKVRSRNPQ